MAYLLCKFKICRSPCSLSHSFSLCHREYGEQRGAGCNRKESQQQQQQQQQASKAIDSFTLIPSCSAYAMTTGLLLARRIYINAHTRYLHTHCKGVIGWCAPFILPHLYPHTHTHTHTIHTHTLDCVGCSCWIFVSTFNITPPHLFATALVPHQRVLLEFSFATGMMIPWCTWNKEWSRS